MKIFTGHVNFQNHMPDEHLNQMLNVKPCFMGCHFNTPNVNNTKHSSDRTQKHDQCKTSVVNREAKNNFGLQTFQKQNWPLFHAWHYLAYHFHIFFYITCSFHRVSQKKLESILCGGTGNLNMVFPFFCFFTYHNRSLYHHVFLSLLFKINYLTLWWLLSSQQWIPLFDSNFRENT